MQIEEEGSWTVSVHVAALSPGEGGGPVGQTVLRTRSAVSRGQLHRGAALCIDIVLLRRQRRKTVIGLTSY